MEIINENCHPTQKSPCLSCMLLFVNKNLCYKHCPARVAYDFLSREVDRRPWLTLSCRFEESENHSYKNLPQALGITDPYKLAKKLMELNIGEKND